MLRKFFIGLSTNTLARKIVTHFPPARWASRRFIAGETLDEAVKVVRELNALGVKALLNEVGESITSQAEAREAAEAIKALLARINAENLDSSVSIKPSHLGMTFGPEFFYELTAEVVTAAQKFGNTVEIDIEESHDVDNTLAVYHRLLDEFGPTSVHLAIQAYLFRTPADVKRIVERGAGIRLVKGAYSESAAIAYQKKEEINQAMKDIMATVLSPEYLQKGAYLALGSHDPALIAWLIQEADKRGIAKDCFEFQMLQGVRRDEQVRLASLGYKMRVYVPFGVAWYPYFMRRLAERPANVFFIARAAVGK